MILYRGQFFTKIETKEIYIIEQNYFAITSTNMPREMHYIFAPASDKNKRFDISWPVLSSLIRAKKIKIGYGTAGYKETPDEVSDAMIKELESFNLSICTEPIRLNKMITIDDVSKYSGGLVTAIKHGGITSREREIRKLAELLTKLREWLG